MRLHNGASLCIDRDADFIGLNPGADAVEIRSHLRPLL